MIVSTRETVSSLKGDWQFPQRELSGTTTLKVCMSKGERQRGRMKMARK